MVIVGENKMIHFDFVLSFERYIIGELILLVLTLAGIIHWGLGIFGGIGISMARSFGYPASKPSGNGGLYVAGTSVVMMIVLTIVYFFIRK